MKNDKGDDDDGGSGSNPPQNNASRTTPMFVSNNFENYRKMKMQDNEHNKDDRKQEEWNHFTTPLSTTHEPLPSPTKDDKKPKYSTPSVFSDLERSQTVDKFMKIFMERIGNVMSSGKLSQAWQGSNVSTVGGGGGGSSMFSWLLTDYSPEAKTTNRQTQQQKIINPDDYAAERKMIHPHLTPAIWGSSCMIVTLFSMRLGRWYQGRSLGSSVNKASHASSISSSKSTNAVKSLYDVRHAKNHHHQSDNGKNPFDSRKELTNNLKASLNTLPVDMALSMLVGISTTLFLTRPDYLMKDVSNAPLLPGKSALAEELCLPFREEMKRVNTMFHTYTPYNANSKDTMPVQRQVVPYSDLWREENLADFDSLRAIRDFVINCHEREKAAKQAMALVDDNDVSEQELMEVKIPPPGISPALNMDEFDHHANGAEIFDPTPK
ncbi:hypothetical protein ACHAXR_002339 [Thalassiosira sp. AJA248-18]